VLDTTLSPAIAEAPVASTSETSVQPRRARVIAFYLPQFHAIPENDEWWGKGFTEWTNVGRARPLYPGHVQPRLPTELGYYDLRVPEVREHQAQLAREYGIEGFCYWHYWFNGRRILQRPFDEVLTTGKPDFPFCLGWANQTWTGIWHGAPNRILIEQTYGGEVDARRHFEAVLPAFLDPRYLTVHGQPIFVLHQPQDLPDPIAFTSAWRRWAQAEGLPGVFFVGTREVGWPHPREYGFDGAFPGSVGRIFHLQAVSGVDRFLRRVLRGNDGTSLARRFLGWPRRIEYTTAVEHALAPDGGEDDFPCVVPNWDNTPRSGSDGLVLTGSTPDRFHDHMQTAIGAVEARDPDYRLVFLKSWNEWAEGNFVEPDATYGRHYLEAIRRAVVPAGVSA
jgi:Glycosyltransferase WbsX